MGFFYAKWIQLVCSVHKYILTTSPAKLSSSLKVKLCAVSSQSFGNNFLTPKFCFLLHQCNTHCQSAFGRTLVLLLRMLTWAAALLPLSDYAWEESVCLISGAQADFIVGSKGRKHIYQKLVVTVIAIWRRQWMQWEGFQSLPRKKSLNCPFMWVFEK